MDLLIFAFLLQLLPVAFGGLIHNDKRSSQLSHLFMVIGLAAGLSVTLSALVSHGTFISQSNFFGFNKNYFSTDALSLYFLFIIQLVAIPTTIYGYSYLQHYIEEGRPVKSFLTFYSIVLVATQLVVISNHSILFLISWEVMSVSAFLGIIFEKEKEEVRTGGMYYLIISHVAGFVLYIFFFLLHHEAKSWFFSDFHLNQSTGNLLIILYLLSFIGFGIKAGIMPFHFWLPKAHPIAPTVLSAFLSAIIIKTGIYGILRTIQFLTPPPEWFAWFVFILGMISAIFGVWYALAQHDLKKLLAYHSVENIGIIVIGIGLGLIGSVYNSPAIQILGFGGALLHTLNHAIFKSLLFSGSGVIYKNLGTRNIELMGGIVHKSKYFVLLFLIGSVAISGIPPLNGFISEFIIYNGFFTTAKELKSYYPLLMLISTVGLAFVGGLAVACFVKINSIMFLGTERREIKSFHVSMFEYLSLGIFAALCIVIGFYPQPFIGIVNYVLQDNFVHIKDHPLLYNINWLIINLSFIAILIGTVGVWSWKIRVQKKYGKKTGPAWGCAYENITPKMQYTASSFADELNSISQSVLLYHKKVNTPEDIFPKPGSFESHSSDLVDNKIILPGFHSFNSFISRINFLNYTDIRYYIAFILLTITIYSLIAFLWN